MIHYIIKISPEMAIKSAPVRRKQLRHLRRNVRRIMRRLDEGITVEPGWDRLEVHVPGGDAASEQRRESGDLGTLGARVHDALLRIPGICQVLLVEQLPWQGFDDVASHVREVYAESLEGRTFAVRVKRRGNHEFTSQQLEQYLGGDLLRTTGARGVDLKNPDVTVRVELRHQELLVVRRRDPGLGGFPLGSQEPVLSLLSGGFDSAVASYLSIRRGLKTHFLFFNLGGTAHEAGVRQMARFLWERYELSHRVYLISIPFEGVVGELMQRVHHSRRGVMLKRLMMQAAERVSDELHISGLVTGESIAQVSSQTPINLALVDQATSMLVMRPLIHMDKSEIIDIASAIGTYEMAANMPEYCGVISDRPTTRASAKRIERDEQFFDYRVLDEAVASRSMQPVDEILQTEVGIDEVPRVNTPSVDDVVIDIRHPEQEEQKPLELTNNEVIQVPFYELNARFASLPQGRRYLLYCDHGTMSAMHADHLKAVGHDNVVVYEPEL